VLALYVVSETYPDSMVAQMVPDAILQKALVLGAVLLVAGIVLRMFDKASKVAAKSRCQVCHVVVPKGAIFCRAHLRRVIHEEDDKLHMTRERRWPQS
jgi:hypothetical protein